MNDKQQLAAMGEHLAGQKPLCMAKRIEELEAQVRVMAGLLREAQRYVRYRLEHTECDARIVMGLIFDIDAALSGKLPAQHQDDAAVDRFAIAMKAKMAAAREKGRGGWDDPNACSVEFLADLLVGHVGKGNQGNFEDIANLAMMLHQRGADPAVLAGKLPKPLVPEGWQLVQVVPGESMCEAGASVQCRNLQSEADWIAGVYGAMLASAPSSDGAK